MKKIGFIGLGNMGKGMSINLSKENHEIIGYDINDNAYKNLHDNKILIADNLSQLISESEIIITMLPDGIAVKKVWSEIILFSRPGQYFIDCSTIDVKTSKSVQMQAREKGLLTLDAPVSGGVIGADQGTLTFMVGGASKTYNDMKFLFEIMGKNSILCGEEGSGQSAKICNNMLLASTMIAVGESFNLGKNLGLDLNKLFDVISTSTGSCWAINSYCPIKGIGPNSPADNNYEGGFATALMYKDLGLAVDAATETKSKINYGIQTYEKYKQVTENNKGNLDFSNIINE
tara:strand:+ start:483 stop:1349 length:867 start_codon:yes stop_codon:yes gene_type:complete